MGKRGPKRTPTITLRNRGSWIAPLREGTELLLPVCAPEPPEFLSPEARKEWDRLVPALMGAGVLTQVDRGALACLCQAWGRWVQAEARIAAEGLTVPTLAGGIKPHPCIGIANAAWGQFIKGCSLFGIDPADRSNVTRGSVDELTQIETLIARLTLARKEANSHERRA